MSKQQQSITSLPLSPDEERHQRVVRYLIAMGIRMVCVILIFFVQGWWQLVVIIGAVVLPYFAVVIANVKMNRGGTIQEPGEYGVLVPLPPKDASK
jgi:hypothetical protein